MLKNINIRDIPEPVYHKAVEWKGKLKAQSWADLLKKLLQIAEEQR